jgi:hypothetical protein
MKIKLTEAQLKTNRTIHFQNLGFQSKSINLIDFFT